MSALPVLTAYFEAFNDGRTDDMLALLTEDVEHHTNQGPVRHGKAAFAEFSAHMSRCYRERLTDLVLFSNDTGTRGAAEFTVNGTYLETDEGLPPARGQGYVLPAGSFFALREGRICRVTTCYNLTDWIAQVSA